MSDNTVKTKDFSGIAEEQSKHQQKVRPTKSFLQSICKMKQEHPINEKDLLEYSSKKNPRLPFYDPIKQKTTKIRKTKKKKKKAPPQHDSLKHNKFLNHQICDWCSPNSTLPNRKQSSSESNDFSSMSEDPEQIHRAICLMREQLLESYIRDIEQKYQNWLQEAEETPAKAFVTIFRNLADFFDDFDAELKDEIAEQLQSSTNLQQIYGQEESVEEFRICLMVNLPALKDFLENFDLRSLDHYETQVKRLCSENALLNLIYQFLDENMKKKKRKRNKKKQKKKKVQEVSTTNTDPGKLADFHCEEEEERFFDTVIENFNKMVIDKKRIKCRVDEEWLQKIKQQIKPS